MTGSAHSLFLSFDYLPRSRSSDPTTTLPGCLANIKQLPNEWYQVTSVVPVESKPHLEPVFSNVSLRLYSAWQGDKPLCMYLFISSSSPMLGYIPSPILSLSTSRFQADESPYVRFFRLKNQNPLQNHLSRLPLRAGQRP